MGCFKMSKTAIFFNYTLPAHLGQDLHRLKTLWCANVQHFTSDSRLEVQAGGGDMGSSFMLTDRLEVRQNMSVKMKRKNRVKTLEKKKLERGMVKVSGNDFG